MKTIHINIGHRTYNFGLAVDLSLPLDFHGPQPNAYGVPPAKARPYSGDGFTLDTQHGGSCNCETITLTPHCHGTHTESVGHITRERFPISQVMPEPFLAATVITVQPNGQAIEADAIEIVKYDVHFLEALIVRTSPNDPGKKTRHWQNESTPYFTLEAMAAIRSLGVRHLLVDLPSLDPLVDGGKLAAHRVFWGLALGSQDVPVGDAKHRTVTEMVFVPDDVPDGRYLLSIQLPRFISDAAPSRPILYFLHEDA
jgi:kynurenine formamidase